jgi:hypothetical protein
MTAEVREEALDICITAVEKYAADMEKCTQVGTINQTSTRHALALPAAEHWYQARAVQGTASQTLQLLHAALSP